MTEQTQIDELRFGDDERKRPLISGARRLWALRCHFEKLRETWNPDDIEKLLLEFSKDNFDEPLSAPEKLALHRMVFGLEAPVAPVVAADPKDWRSQFRKVSELEDGGVKMLVNGLLPEGTSFIGGLSGQAKTLLALSLVKALTTGAPMFGHFEVPQKHKVLYLIPESSGRAFKSRLYKFQIPDDDSFLCRTLSEGPTLRLNDPIILEAVRQMKCVVVLDTAVRFSNADDENSALDNQELVNDIIRLRWTGAPAVIGIHHATKSSRNEEINLENSLRGTGDLAAMCDAVYGIRRDEKLYENGRGPLEFEVVCTKPRDFDPPLPFRIAATYKNEVGALFSNIDEKHDFVFVDRVAEQFDEASRVVKFITANPQVGLREIGESLGYSKNKVSRILTHLGYTKPNGKWIVGQSVQDESDEDDDDAKEA
jgi:hypothetical protein